ncbi:hypothetical protein MLD38_025404 [Melastoma candidum]|uniref:Uncharacterized protein n=1 Tax=Melastoma candidum TaxID=119954 RepID=A0ACB9NVA5_9MYRT|nr:hypothetical protein MLD38_025404 [Melastoma candidum]
MRNPSSSSSSAAKTTCCSKVGLKRGPWTPEEDTVLVDYINRNGEGMWRTLPKRAGLLRCGKSCRLRWMNYLRPSVKHGHIEADEEDLILRLHRLLGNRWSLIAGRIPGRTDNEIKNYWNAHLRKKLIRQGIDPKTHRPINKNPVPPFQQWCPDEKHSNCAALVGNLSYAAEDRDNPHLYVGGGGGGGHGGSEIGSINQIDATLADEEVEDVFSSFLNSLMNDDSPFTSSNQPMTLLQPLPQPSPFDFDHGLGYQTVKKAATSTPFTPKMNSGPQGIAR